MDWGFESIMLGTEGEGTRSSIFRRNILPTASGSESMWSKHQAELFWFLVQRWRRRQYAPPTGQYSVTSQRRLLPLLLMQFPYFNLNICRLHREVFVRELRAEKCAWSDTYCYVKLMQCSVNVAFKLSLMTCLLGRDDGTDLCCRLSVLPSVSLKYCSSILSPVL